MSYVLDTTIASEIMKGNQVVLRRLQRVPVAEQIYLSAVGYGELMFGALSSAGGSRDRLLQAIDGLLDVVSDIVPVGMEVAVRYGELRRELAVRGTPIPDNDLWIASVASAHDLTLVAHDHHFAYVESLKMEDWLA